MHNPPIQDEPTGPSFFERLCKRLVLVVLGSLAAAAILHYYRIGQLPVIQQPLPGFEHPLFSTPAPAAAAVAPSDSADPMSSLGEKGPVSAGSFPRSGQPLGTPAPTNPTAAPWVWTRQDFASLSLEAPVILKTAPPNVAWKPADLKHIVDQFRWEGKTADGFEVESLFLRIDGAHTLSMEDGVRGAVKYITKVTGDPSPAYRRQDIFVNGVPGRFLTYAGMINGTNQHCELLVLQNTRDAMLVGVYYAGERHIADAQRVLGSVQVRR